MVVVQAINDPYLHQGLDERNGERRPAQRFYSHLNTALRKTCLTSTGSAWNCCSSIWTTPWLYQGRLYTIAIIGRGSLDRLGVPRCHIRMSRMTTEPAGVMTCWGVISSSVKRPRGNSRSSSIRVKSGRGTTVGSPTTCVPYGQISVGPLSGRKSTNGMFTT